MFSDRKCNVDLDISYELNRWFGQNIVRQSASESRQINAFPVLNSTTASTRAPSNVSNHATYPADLLFQGLTLTLRVDF